MKYKSSSSCCPGGDGEHRITWQIGVIRVEVGWLSVSLTGDLQFCISKSARYIPPGAVRQVQSARCSSPDRTSDKQIASVL
ncbi:hypothetical protein DTO271D3_8492 [Paecilomyces variotii]|nr:hypothetical protein DTO271D3_8492 [Paecilomyces variotii]